MESARISKLKPTGDTPAINIRVLRKWIPDHRDNELHFLFVDKEGSAIQAVVKGEDRACVDTKLKINTCYKMDGYACVVADDYTNNLLNPGMLRIGAASVFTPIPDTGDIQDYYYEFATRSFLELQSQKTKGIADYIGILQSMKDKTTRDNKPYIVMSLRDCSNKLINVALWNRTIRLPHKFNRAQIESAAKPIILGITALHVTNYEGTLQLKTTNASYVYLNPKAAETRMLEELYRSGVPCGTQSTMLTQNTIPLSQILQ